MAQDILQSCSAIAGSGRGHPVMTTELHCWQHRLPLHCQAEAATQGEPRKHPEGTSAQTAPSAAHAPSSAAVEPASPAVTFSLGGELQALRAISSQDLLRPAFLRRGCEAES